MRRTAAVAAAGLVGALLLPAQPADAFFQTCVGLPGTPHVGSTTVRGEGRVFCVGWANGTLYELEVQVQERLGVLGHRRWVLAPMLASAGGVGPNVRRGWYLARRDVGRHKYRTRVRYTILATPGVIIKRSGWVASPAVRG